MTHEFEDWTTKDLEKLERSAKMAYREKEYISTTDTAKLIREQLKKKFPKVKFGVRSSIYSGGSSIRVSWTDGPKTKEVEAVTGPFAGSGFDGMIDLKYSVESWLLPDGSVSFGRSEGTGGSHGSCPGFENPAPVEGAKLVRFSADHVFCSREYSELATLKACLIVHEKWGLPLLGVEMTEWGARLKGDCNARPLNGSFNNSDLVHQELTEMEL
jgi:hypothetical protein